MNFSHALCAARRALPLLMTLISTCAAQGALDGWFERVSKTQAEQPHWITPVVTVTPRLEQEFRYDISAQELASGATTVNIGGGKGGERIPSERVEVTLGSPPYLDLAF